MQRAGCGWQRGQGARRRVRVVSSSGCVCRHRRRRRGSGGVRRRVVSVAAATGEQAVSAYNYKKGFQWAPSMWKCSPPIATRTRSRGKVTTEVLYTYDLEQELAASIGRTRPFKDFKMYILGTGTAKECKQYTRWFTVAVGVVE